MANIANRSNKNQLIVPGVEQAVEEMKTEIAMEFGVSLNGQTSARANGSVGGEMTKRLVQAAQKQVNTE